MRSWMCRALVFYTAQIECCGKVWGGMRYWQQLGSSSKVEMLMLVAFILYDKLFKVTNIKWILRSNDEISLDGSVVNILHSFKLSHTNLP